jgi:hypothetical protein
MPREYALSSANMPWFAFSDSSVKTLCRAAYHGVAVRDGLTGRVLRFQETEQAGEML